MQRFAVTLCSAWGVAQLVLLAGIGAANADVVISSRSTVNMNCGSSGYCEPTAANAVLNAGDLEHFVAQYGNFHVVTSGQNVEATNIVVKAAFGTPDSTSLTLEALGAIRIEAPVAIGSGTAELQMQSGQGGTLGDVSFGDLGHITFGSTSDLFNINGAVFQLVGSLPDLVTAISHASGGGFYVLANSYDASADGTYGSAPIGIPFSGYFEALGNTISKLKIRYKGGSPVGLFSELSGSQGFGDVRNLRLANVNIEASANEIAGMAGIVDAGAAISQSSVSGSVIADSGSIVVGGLTAYVGGAVDASWSRAKVQSGDGTEAGGLAGDVLNTGAVENSYAVGTVATGNASDAGGLAGVNQGVVDGSFATGAVQNGGGGSAAGGLLGVNTGTLTNSYAEGSLTEASFSTVSYFGGLMGLAGVGSQVRTSYATGGVSANSSDLVGGVVGWDDTSHGFSRTSWDTTTSGLAQGAGNIDSDPGLKGLTSKTLRSRLPRGFDRNVWKEKGNTNRGFPYLIANPPPE